MNQDRYSRQRHIIKDFDQEALCRATVLIVGVGGLGTHVATSLTTAGVGRLLLCDHDTVSITNLNRQPLYCEKDLGYEKVNIALNRLTELNPHLQLIAYNTKFSAQTMEEVKAPDLIIDCLDNMASRVELIRYAARHKIPLIHGAVEGFSGQISVYIPGKSACPLCIIEEFVFDNDVPPSSLGSCVSLTAALQATEAIKLLTGSGELCMNKMLCFDALTGIFDSFEIERDSTCRACSQTGVSR